MALVPATPRFRRLLLNAIFVPLVLMVLIAVVLIGQITLLLQDSAQVERSDQFIAKTSELQTLTIDLETGLRGYLVTGDQRFLEPYRQSLLVIDKASSDLQNATNSDDLKNQVRQLDIARNHWLDYAKNLIDLRSHNGDYREVVMSLVGKQQMDAMREMFRRLIDSQSKVRGARFREAERESHMTLIVVAGVTVLGGGVLAILSRNRFVDITRAYDVALKTATDLNQSLELRVHERTAELEQRSSELTEANKELEAFSYSISHDLRAPLRHIAGFASLLDKSAGSNFPESDRENLTTIRETATLAGRMVDDLLSFSRIGRGTIRAVPVDLNTMVTDCLTELTPDTRNRSIEFNVGKLPTVLGDPALVKMVLFNLLANAIKYTSKRDKAIIEMNTAAAATDGGKIDTNVTAICFVRDNGVGFNMQYAGKLFGVFQRLHRAEEFEGTGIGLANVKRIVNRLGGRVWAEGELDRGATFYFTIPLATKGST